MKNTNAHPAILMDAVHRVNSGYSKEGSWRSVTELVGNDGMLQAYLKHRPNDCVQDLDESLAAWRGTITHDAIEACAVKGREIVEKRLHAIAAGRHISGKLDHLELHDPVYSGSTLRDWKQSTAKSLIFGQKERFGVKSTHAWQVFVLYWLIIRNRERNGVGWSKEVPAFSVPVPDNLEVFYIVTDRSPWKSRTVADYPKTSGVRKWLRPPSLDEIEEYLLGRIEHHEAWDDYPPESCPPCSDEHRWQQPSAWALTTPGRKSAIKVEPTKDELMLWLESPKGEKYRRRKLEITERKGMNVRCADWCPARHVCPLGIQAQAEKE